MSYRRAFVPIVLLVIASMILAAGMNTSAGLAKTDLTKVPLPVDETATPITGAEDWPGPWFEHNSLAGVNYYAHNEPWGEDVNLPDLVSGVPEGKRGWNIAVVNDAMKECNGDLSTAIGPAFTAHIDGLVNIVRIDYKQEDSSEGKKNIAVPRYTQNEDYGEWIKAFAECVYRFRNYKDSKGEIHDLANMFIVGNEPNLDGNVSSGEYFLAFNALWDEKHKIFPPNSDTQLLAAGPSAFDPNSIKWMAEMTQGLEDVDGFAIHTYGIREKCVDPQQPCDMGWGFDGGFRFYRDLIKDGIAGNWWSRPIYITEFNTWPGDKENGVPVNTPNDNYISGWIQKAFSDVRDYNSNRKGLPEVKALSWFVDDGSSGWKDFSLQVGFKNPVTHWRLLLAYQDMQTEFHNPANRGLLNAKILETESNIPVKMLPGETRRATVRVLNTGLTTWQARSIIIPESKIKYGLATTSNNQIILSNPDCRSDQYDNVTVFEVCRNVSPGTTYDFSFDMTMPINVTAPAKLELQMASLSGKYLFWFGEVGSWQIEAINGSNPLATGEYHSCALTNISGVKCWGWNIFGQLGDGTTVPYRTAPVDVVGLDNSVSTIAAGGVHTCALTSTGGVKCWGDNRAGQLGDGTLLNRWVPVDVNGLNSGVVDIAAGRHHTCALTSTGGVKCWGYNYYGQIGDGTTYNRLTPVDVVGLSSDVVSISAGYYHTCALTSAGGVECWGHNSNGELGDGTTTDHWTPVDVVGLSNAVSTINAGGVHTCALTSAGGAKCWGLNIYGQIGDGTTAPYRTTPVDVVDLSSDAVSIKAGTYHTCALINSGEVKCWGYNAHGELGDGTTTNHTTPVNVIGLTSDEIAIAAGQHHTCTLSDNGSAKCWGMNNNGQLGNGTTVGSLTPVDVIGLP